MKLKSVFIKNFKKFEKHTQPLNDFSIFLGENDSGKSTILQSINILLSKTEKIDKIYIPNPDEETVIGGLFELDDGSRKYLKKTFSKKTFKLDEANSDVGELDNTDIHLVYISCETLDPKKLCADLALAKAKERTSQETLDSLLNIFNEAINDTIATIDERILVIDKLNTTLVPSSELKFESFVKYTIKVDGIDIDARGSGFKKNFRLNNFVSGNNRKCYALFNFQILKFGRDKHCIRLRFFENRAHVPFVPWVRRYIVHTNRNIRHKFI
mgnify:CR=1 FL=1